MLSSCSFSALVTIVTYLYECISAFTAIVISTLQFEMFEDGSAIFHPNGELFKDSEAFALGEAVAKAERDQLEA